MKNLTINPEVGKSFIAKHKVNELQKAYNNKPIKKGDVITPKTIINTDCFECENIKQAFGLNFLLKNFKPFEC